VYVYLKKIPRVSFAVALCFRERITYCLRTVFAFFFKCFMFTSVIYFALLFSANKKLKRLMSAREIPPYSSIASTVILLDRGE